MTDTSPNGAFDRLHQAAEVQRRVNEAVKAALAAASEHARLYALPRVIRFVLFDARAMTAFDEALAHDAQVAH